MKPLARADKISEISRWIDAGTINIFGLPFAGKDTQGKFLAKVLGAPLIGGGDILRHSAEHATVQQKVNGGKLAPSEDFLRIILPYLAQPAFINKPLVLSSVGRWYGEHEPVMQAAEQAGHPFKAVIYLHLTKNELMKRWDLAHQNHDRGAREDDAHGALDTRIDEFNKKTKPVLDFYEQVGLLVEVDGTQNPDQVSNDIIDELYTKSLQ